MPFIDANIGTGIWGKANGFTLDVEGEPIDMEIRRLLQLDNSLQVFVGIELHHYGLIRVSAEDFECHQ